MMSFEYERLVRRICVTYAAELAIYQLSAVVSNVCEKTAAHKEITFEIGLLFSILPRYYWCYNPVMKMRRY